MIARGTALSLLEDILGNDDEDNELKKAYFAEHPLHGDAVDKLWGLNWFANGYPHDEAGKPKPIADLAPDEQRETVDSLKALYPLRSEIDRRHGKKLSWNEIGADAEKEWGQAQQRYLSIVDPVYSAALYDQKHLAHPQVKDHFSQWQDWQFGGRKGPIPAWNGIAEFAADGEIAKPRPPNPLRNPWLAAGHDMLKAANANTQIGADANLAVDDILGRPMDAIAAAIKIPTIRKLPNFDTDPDAPKPPAGPTSQSILDALTKFYGAAVFGRLGDHYWDKKEILDAPEEDKGDDLHDNSQHNAQRNQSMLYKPDGRSLEDRIEIGPDRGGPLRPNDFANADFDPRRDRTASPVSVRDGGKIDSDARELAEQKFPQTAQRGQSPEDLRYASPPRVMVGIGAHGRRRLETGADDEFFTWLRAATREERLQIFAAVGAKKPSDRTIREKLAAELIVVQHSVDPAFNNAVRSQVIGAIDSYINNPKMVDWRDRWSGMSLAERKAAIVEIVQGYARALDISVPVRFDTEPRATIGDGVLASAGAGNIVPLDPRRGTQCFAEPPHIVVREDVISDRVGPGSFKKFNSPDAIARALFEEAFHTYQMTLIDRFMRGILSPNDPRYDETRWLAANMSAYYFDGLHPSYQNQPFENGAKDWDGLFKERLGIK